MKKPKVSVTLMTYNHENYIANAIESVVNQKTNFDYEILIGEDCSTDNTSKIVKEYENKYPEKIRAFLNKKNLGTTPNSLRVFSKVKGEYMAILEGDDYWCDENKLQKQVDFLDANPDYSLCCTKFYTIKEIENFKIKNKTWEEHFEDEQYSQYRDVTLDNIFSPYILRPLSSLFRFEAFLKTGLNKFNQDLTELLLFPMILKSGKGAVLNDYTAVYRERNSQNWNSKPEEKRYEIVTQNFYHLSQSFEHKNTYILYILLYHIDYLVTIWEKQPSENSKKISNFLEMKKDLLEIQSKL